MQKLAKFECYVGVLNGKLHTAHLVNGWPKFVAGDVNWIEVDANVSQDFLDAANLSLGTDYRMEDLRKKNLQGSSDAGFRGGVHSSNAELRSSN
ncbi:MAG: hypothetical protein ACXWQO_16680 [Bdellovibrionota bacterium]